MSFPKVFKLSANSDSVSFTLVDNTVNNSLITSKKDKSKNFNHCQICKGSHGLMVSGDSLKPGQIGLKLYAHVFCILSI